MDFIGLLQFPVDRELLDHHLHFWMDQSCEVEIDVFFAQVLEYLFQSLDSVNIDMIDLSEAKYDGRWFMELFRLTERCFYIEIIERSRKPVYHRIVFFLYPCVSHKRKLVEKFPVPEDTDLDISIGNFSDKDNERHRRTEDNPDNRIVQNRDSPDHEGDIERCLVHGVDIPIQADIHHTDGDIHKNSRDNRHRQEFEKIEQEPSDDEGKNCCQECGHTAGRSAFRIEGGTNEDGGRRETSGESGSDIGKTESENFFVLVESLLGHLLGDLCGDDGLQNRDNRYNKGKSENNLDSFQIGKHIGPDTGKIRHIHQREGEGRKLARDGLNNGKGRRPEMCPL